MSFQRPGFLHFRHERLYYVLKRATTSDRRFADMKIEKVLAVYKTSPLLLVVETEEGKVCELSLKGLKDAGHNFRDAAWKSLVEEYQIFTCQHASRSPTGA